MIKRWFNYIWMMLFNLFYSNSAIESSSEDVKIQNFVVLALICWNYIKRTKIPEPEKNLKYLENQNNNNEKMASSTEMVSVDDKMNQVAESAPAEIGRVIESDIDTNEETTSTEISKDTDTSKFQKQSEEYEAKGKAVIIGTSGKTESAVEAKSSESAARSEYSEGNRKVLSTSTSSSKSYSFEETTEYEY